MSLNFLVRNRSAEETVRMAAVRAQFAEVAGSIRVYFLYFQEGSNPLDRIERRRRSGGPGRRGTAARQAWAHRGTRVCERNAYSRKTLLRLPRIFGDHRSPYWKGCSLDTARSGTAGDFELEIRPDPLVSMRARPISPPPPRRTRRRRLDPKNFRTSARAAPALANAP